MMTEQEFFDRAVMGVLRQGSLSFEGVRCFYRGPNGLKCAVGHVIEDSEVIEKTLAVALPVFCDPHGRLHHLRDLARILQRVHDDADSLTDFATRANRDVSKLFPDIDRTALEAWITSNTLSAPSLT